MEQFFQIFCLHPALLLSENPVVVIPRICLFSTASSHLILSPIILLWQILGFLKIFRELLMSCWLLKHTDPSLHLNHEIVVKKWYYLKNIFQTSEKWKDEKRLKVDWGKKDILPTIPFSATLVLSSLSSSLAGTWEEMCWGLRMMRSLSNFLLEKNKFHTSTISFSKSGSLVLGPVTRLSLKNYYS